jgi:hypothetical protein
VPPAATLPPELLAWESRGTYLRVGPAAHRLYVQSVGAGGLRRTHEKPGQAARNQPGPASRGKPVVQVP